MRECMVQVVAPNNTLGAAHALRQLAERIENANPHLVVEVEVVRLHLSSERLECLEEV